MKILVTGGAGFIGSALVRHLIQETEHTVLNLDCLTYAGNLESISQCEGSIRYSFEKVDICDKENLSNVISSYKPQIIMHLAAESHVDRSIDSPSKFIETNIIGTFNLLECSRDYLKTLKDEECFRFHHISTDEVFGDLKEPTEMFTEDTPYRPSSPYSASKASSDHLVRSWARTFNLPVIITNCSNNYGPYHFPEKLIPHMIISALKGEPLPVYGNGLQVRDWLYVEDHVRALMLVALKGKTGETYNIGGNNEKSNIEVVKMICDYLEELAPFKPKGVTRFSDLISFVDDRPGHDLRYSIDASKIQNELDWFPEESFETGLFKTIQWYIDNKNWWERVISGEYRLERIGKKK